MDCEYCGAPILDEVDHFITVDVSEIPTTDQYQRWGYRLGSNGLPVEHHYHRRHAHIGLEYWLGEDHPRGGESLAKWQQDARRQVGESYWNQVAQGIQPAWRPMFR